MYVPLPDLRWHLDRRKRVGDSCLGRWVSPESTVLHSLENFKLRFPPGLYLCQRGTYYGGDGIGGRADYPTFEIPVRARAHIKVHAANFPWELQGCVALGLRTGYKQGHGAVWDSMKAHHRYMREARGFVRHWLYVTEPHEWREGP